MRAMLATHTRPGTSTTFADALPFALNARQRLDEFIGDLRIPLRGSKDRARDIITGIELIQDGASKTPPAALPAPLSEALWQNLIAFQNVFQTECARLPLYLITEKRGWDVATLSEHAQYVLPALAWASLSTDETRDIQAAGRCLAFEVPTAAAFHLYRLLESFVLKYMPFFGVELRDADRNLGNYIKILKDNGVDDKITKMLQHIKDEYRNPAIHPGLFFTVDGASSQFALVQSAANMIIEDLLIRLGPDFVWPSEIMAKHFAWVRGQS
jgi:hypothetical protein